MEHLKLAIEDPTVKNFLARFSQKEWNEVIKETLKLGIHSMNTLQSLNIYNSSPEKCLNNSELDGGLEDDSTVLLADSLQKLEKTTPSSKETTKLIRNDSKLVKNKKKAHSQVNKTKISRVTPKAKRILFEAFRDKKDGKRIHSVKNKQKNETIKIGCKEFEAALVEGKKKFSFERKESNNAKSFKDLKNKPLEIHLSPHALKVSPKNVKGSLGMNDFNEFYKDGFSCRNKKVEFPLKVKKNLDIDPFVYVTSSSDESFS